MFNKFRRRIRHMTLRGRASSPRKKHCQTLAQLAPLLAGFLLGVLCFCVHKWLLVQTANTIREQQLQTSGGGGPLIDRNLLLVGVMTAARFLDTRALEIWRTWARRVPGRVIFFVAEGTEISERVRSAAMPIVALRGVDDAYPPQKKSFAMLRWMYDNQLANFHWFMRADDDIYVRTAELKHFLRSLDADKAHLLGQAGLGNSEEYGQLALGAHDNYCMGGPGVLLSRETLRQLAPHLQQCLAHLLTTHEDVELGRCIRRHVGIACTWNYEMQTLFHNNASVAQHFAPASGGDGISPQHGGLSLRRLITLHPVKRPEAMHRVHVSAELWRLKQKRQRHAELLEQRDQLVAQRRRLDGGSAAVDGEQHNAGGERRNGQQQAEETGPNLSDGEGARFSGLIGRPPNSSAEIGRWEFVSSGSKLLYCAHHTNCPRHTLDAAWRRAMGAIVTELFDQFNAQARNRGRTLHFQSLQYAMLRLRPRFGVDLVLDMALWYRRFRSPSRQTLAVRRHAYVQRRFGPLESRIVPMSSARMGQVVHLVVALKGRSATFARFAHNLVELARAGQPLRLVVVLYESSSLPGEAQQHSNGTRGNDDRSIESSVALLRRHLPVELVRMPPLRAFNRGEALSAGAALLRPEALLFFVDVDVLMRPEALDRVRLNTVKGQQVYFPIVFSEFSPRTWNQSGAEAADHFVYEQRRGYFRHFGFGLVAIFGADFDAVGRFNESIRGWGLEDVDLYERVTASTALRPFRVPDPGLVHVFHTIECSASGLQNEAQRRACEGTRAQSVASADFLALQFGPYI